MSPILIDCRGRLIPSGRFPEPWLANRDGLVALGGDLEPETLLAAYRRGIFPWSVDPISWWSPDPRAIIEFHEFRWSKRRQRYLRNGGFTFTFDTAFTRVMTECARSVPGRRSTWISPEFIRAYSRLHELGHAHSVECWQGTALVGGVYGVAVGGLFAGESMFSRVSNASTLALAVLLRALQDSGFVLFDTQVLSPHTASLGAREIPRRDYLARLAQAVKLPCTFPRHPPSGFCPVP
ncbi:MAG: Leucyl/phenylalanyl-tRNA--protein transferase [Candidatus Ozemobacter sibiricus]|jgi:leucyl/phenylalanyl-tRNA--protein transferase|uniref:Leucyl/phenylalanyl-tRNA--protein transferase n=1 Tax=Candidatus Ozemobacter sibiricus TaxID=2268124 RepID=A0A367ZIB0_9BACT|nr:MAG: Leucyl/phenylalanyl-tRNA--protein transferase [Candidatus Ozemobacter sibiricus]